MMIRLLTVALALGFGAVACAPGAVVAPTKAPRVQERQPEIETDSDDDGEPEAADGAPEPVSDARCAKVCRHIFDVSTGELPDEAAAPWIADCTARCVEHASDGQLACYERVVRADELSVCSVF